ncbi:hypothetical protein MPTK1_8g04390 [Marchantia polymorpha subsp. ruderalis]|uniref:Uncharacterized protein n=1 Tax=Marchantia polymorpha TaxID=3197 RepID=A0A2R6VXU7_MARPO|nr:hypothetical protein MARPO_1908s0001 [Marchantia polymorpha]BBN18663.1 hypothetical protein Mp_8g04390 [Marchantia polymorpha subsp. ruderalis]|eukprot:PTQ26413.1 hypothetical protein MARPO_1908s0001 [Marchantia polymorpha]
MAAGHNERKYLLFNPVTRRVENLPGLPKLLVGAELQMSGTYILTSVEMVTPMGTGGTESRFWPKLIALERYSGVRGSDTLNMWRFVKYDDNSSTWQVVSMLCNCSIELKKLATTLTIVSVGVGLYYHYQQEESRDVQLEEKEVKLRNCATVEGEIFLLWTSVKGPSKTPDSINTRPVGYIEEWFGSALMKLMPYNSVEFPLNIRYQIFWNLLVHMKFP